MKKFGKAVGVIAKCGVFFGSIGGVIHFAQKEIKRKEDVLNRYKMYYELTNQWLLNKNDGKNVGEYFERKNYKSIAVYGQGTLGELFCREARNQNVNIEYLIDKNADSVCYSIDDVPTIPLDEICNQNGVDVIVVTPIANYDDIVNDLGSMNVNCDIISLEDVIYEL